jgi:polyvinyl alcohol dehydrogenase (cytochrome)
MTLKTWGALAGAATALTLALTPGASGGATPSSWATAGHDLSDTRFNADGSTIGPENAARLATKWAFTTHGDVSATATVVGGAVFFPDWGGYLYKLDAATGSTIWSRKVSDYTGIPGDVARTSPAVDGGTIYVGDQSGAHLIAVDAATGDARWVTALDDHFASALTQSPIVYRGVVYEGVSSNEEAFSALIPNYPCCSFRGSMTAVSAATGAILWKTRMAPAGYSGAAVWNGTPALDPDTNTLYVGTGNNYSVPDTAQTCQDSGGTPQSCLSPDDHIDAIVALDTLPARSSGRPASRASTTGTPAASPASASPATAPSTPVPTPTSGPASTSSRSGRRARPRRSSARGRSRASTGRSTRQPGRSSGAPPSAPAPRSAASSGAPRPTASASTSPSRTSTTAPTNSRTDRRSARARGRRSTPRPASSSGRSPTLPAASTSARSRPRTASSTHPR